MITTIVTSVVGVVLLLVSLLRPFTGIIILLWTLWLSETLTVKIGPVTVNRVLGLVILCGFALQQKWRGKGERFVFARFDYYVWAYIFVILLSVLVNGVSLNVGGRFRNVVMGYLFYFLVVNLVNSWEKLRIVNWNLIIATLVVSGGVYYELFSIPASIRKLRIGGTLQSVHYAAQFIFVGAILCVLLLETRKEKTYLHYYILYGLLFVFAGALLLTGSRTEFGVFFLALIGLSFMSRKLVDNIKRLAVIGGFFLVVAYVLAPLSPYAIHRVVGLLPGYSTVFDVPSQYKDSYELLARGQKIREQLNHAALQIFIEHPILGAGYDSFAKINRPYSGLSKQKSGHNAFYIALAETGLLGATVLGGMYLEVLLPLWRTRKLSNSHALTANYMLVMIIGLNIVIASLLADDVERHMYLLFALGAATTRISQEEQYEVSTRREILSSTLTPTRSV